MAGAALTSDSTASAKGDAGGFGWGAGAGGRFQLLQFQVGRGFGPLALGKGAPFEIFDRRLGKQQVGKDVLFPLDKLRIDPVGRRGKHGGKPVGRAAGDRLLVAQNFPHHLAA